MPVIAAVIYPHNPSSTKFDMDYYLSTHMPLVMENWGPMGLQKWEIVHTAPNPIPMDGSQPKFSVMALLTWGDAEQVKKAMTSEQAGAVFGDIPNFTNETPTLVLGDVVGTS